MLFFETYIHQILVPLLWQGAIVVIDNLSVHKSSKIRQAIESVGAKLVFLPRNCGLKPPLLRG
ncbi:MAG: hypothetical protein F6K18_10865 [Okeania sp. SIO2C2]|uniref:transposase n=1 Tax=Okeania sp. SIO2C2 TaxID=2607787 RepID=UPI0013BAA094|nr:transposase [Okeania sp. SIO2C2]NEP87287.1 hypothetical protein [Okeania sp. SIO2C2]